MYQGRTSHIANLRVEPTEPFWMDQRGRVFRSPDDFGPAHLLNVIQWIRRKRQQAIDEDQYHMNQLLYTKERALIRAAKQRGLWGPIMEGG